jgi:phosphoglycerate dehydrogenase-like enzyme
MAHPKTLICCYGYTEYSRAILRQLHDAMECDELDLKGDLVEQFRGVAMVIDLGGGASKPMIDAAVDCKFWQVIGTGLDHCDVDHILSKGIPLANTPGFASVRGLAESAMMFMLMLTRKYNEARENFFSGKFYQPNGATLDGLTLGIIGYGASGRWLARQAKHFGMRIEAIDVRPLEADLPVDQQPDFHGTADEMDTVISRCDVLSVHLHLTPETKHIIDARRLALMKPTAFLVNVARGALVDEDALAEAVTSGKIAGAGVDAFAAEPADAGRPEYQLPNFIVTPHTAGQTDDTVRRRCQIVVENARRLAEGEELLYLVDASLGLGRA